MTEENESAPVPAEPPGPATAESNRASESRDEPEAWPQVEPTANDNTARPKTEFERKLGMYSTGVQIAAIIIGGIFAIIKFGFLDSPALQKNIRVSGSLDWAEHDDSSCLALIDIDVKNLSKSRMEIKQVRGRAWIIEEPQRSEKAIQYFNVGEETKRKNPIEDFHYEEGPLVQEYATEQSAHHSFEWYVEHKKDTKKGSYAAFEIDVFDKVEVFNKPGVKDPDPLDYQIQWDSACDIKPAKPPNSAEKQK
jgi:hypothetical protein